MSTKPETATQQPDAWRNFAGASWKRDIDVRDFISTNVTPYAGDEAFLAGPTKRTSAVWEKLQPYFSEESKKGVLDVDAKTPSSLTSHGPGYIDRDNEVIVGLQTDKPFRRAIMPMGGYKMVEDGLKAYGLRDRSRGARDLHEIPQDAQRCGLRSLHAGDSRAAGNRSILTGLPDAYGRGRIIGDYRRVALYGVDRLIAAKKEERAQIDGRWPTEEVMQLRRIWPTRSARSPTSRRWRHRMASTSAGPPRTRARPCSGPTSATSARSRK